MPDDSQETCWECHGVAESCHARALAGEKPGGYPGDRPCRKCGVNHWPRCNEPLSPEMLRGLTEDIVRRHCWHSGEPYAYVNASLNDVIGVFTVEECTAGMLQQRLDLARLWFGPTGNR